MNNLHTRLGRLGEELVKASPILVPIYFALLAGLQGIPVRNPNANLERLAILQQQLAFFVTLDGFLVWKLIKHSIRLRR